MGETPAKKNSKILTKSGKFIPGKVHSKWHTDALIQMNAQIHRMQPNMPNLIDEPIILRVDFYHGNLIRRDSDNQLSSILDLLQDSKVLADDKWEIVREIHVRNFYEKNEPRAIIEIEKCEKKGL